MLSLCLSMMPWRCGNTEFHAMSTSALDGGEWFAECFPHHTKAEIILRYPADGLSGSHSLSGYCGEMKNLSLLRIYAHQSVKIQALYWLSYPKTSYKLKGLIKICNFYTIRVDCSYCGLVGLWSFVGRYQWFKGMCCYVFRVEMFRARNWLSETGKLQGSYRKNSLGLKDEFMTYLMIWLLSLLENAATVHCEGFV